MSAEKLRVGVIGLGFIGSLHARIMSELNDVELVAVNDAREALASETAEKYGCACYADYKDMILAGGLDAVSITLPDEEHLPAAVFAAEHGLAVLLEKPIAKTANDARIIIDTAKRCGTRLMIGHVLHFDPRYAQLREAIKSGQLGDIVHMFFKRTNPRQNARRVNGRASILHYIGVHDFEMMLACARSKPASVYCKKICRINAEYADEDSVFATITFHDGSLGVIELCWALPDNSALGINTYAEVVGTKAAGYVNILDQGVSIITSDSVEYPDTLHWPEYNGMIQGDLRAELAHFVRRTLTGGEYIVDSDNALTAARVIDACFESMRTQLPVDVLDC